MGEHDHVGVDTHDGSSPSHVGFDEVFTEERVRDIWVINGYEDGGLELVGGWVVELFHEREGLFLYFLRI